MKIKQWLYITCVVFYVANHMLVAGATPNTTILENTSLGDAHVGVNNIHNASVTIQNNTADDQIVLLDDNDSLFISDNVSVDLNNTDNASVLVSDTILDNTTTRTPDSVLYEVNEILVQATALIRLKSNNADDINNAVLHWYHYCENFVLKAWKTIGYNQSSLTHAYDWVQIDDSMLDVFFMGKYIHNPDTIPIHCLSSTQTMQNTTSLDDACSQLTLGGFGDDLTLASRAKLNVKTNFAALFSNVLQTHTYMLKSIAIVRMSFDFSPAQIQLQQDVLQAQDSQISMFDNSIVQSRNAGAQCPRDQYRAANNALIVEGDICEGQGGPGYVKDVFELAAYTHNGREVWVCFTDMGWRWIYYISYFTRWYIGSELGMEETSPRVLSTSIRPPESGYVLSCNYGAFFAWPGTIKPACTACPSNSGSNAAVSIMGCNCKAGYTGSPGSSCNSCPAGTYKSGMNSDSCTSCVEHTTSLIASKTITDCVCKPGIGLDWSGKCNFCEAGKWKADQGSVPCRECVAGKYSAVSGANNLETCKNCLEHTISSSGSAQCICETGFVQQSVDENDALICGLCAVGKYSIAQGTKTKCELCIAGKYSPNVGAKSIWNCIGCPVQSDSVEGSGVCTCGDGFAMNADNVCDVKMCASGPVGPEGARCEPCDAGNYKPETGNDCHQCAAGTFREYQSDEVNCSSCPPGTYAPDLETVQCQPCYDGIVSDDRTKCIVIETPKILNGQTRLVFDHFKPATSVKSILQTAYPLEWMNGDSLAIYENGTRGLNPITLVFNDIWSPVNIDPVHYRDNVYIFTTNRTNELSNSVLMSLEWQITVNARLLSETEYSQVIGMGLYYLRKHPGILTGQQAMDEIANHSHYEPFGVRILNNEPSYTTIINYTLKNHTLM